MFYRVRNTIETPLFDKIMGAKEISEFFNPVMRLNEGDTWLINEEVVTPELIEGIEATFAVPTEAPLHALYRNYPSIGEQLDALYKDIMNGTLTPEGEFASMITAIKTSVAKTEEKLVVQTTFESPEVAEPTTDTEYTPPPADAPEEV